MEEQSGADYIMTLLAINTLNQRAFQPACVLSSEYKDVFAAFRPRNVHTVEPLTHTDGLQVLTMEAPQWSYGLGQVSL